MKRWNKQHTDVYKRYFRIRSEYPFSNVSHFTVTPKGNKVSLETLKSRINNVFSTTPIIYAMMYNHEVSDQGVFHVHGFIFSPHGWNLTPYFNNHELSFLVKKGGTKGWIRYFLKEKGKTIVRRRNVPIEIQQNFL